MVKLEDSDQYQELAGISALYIAVQQKLPGSLLTDRVPRMVAQEAQEGWTIRIF